MFKSSDVVSLNTNPIHRTNVRKYIDILFWQDYFIDERTYVCDDELEADILNNDNINNINESDGYFIYVGNKKIPVSEVIYKEFCRGARKEQYFRESDLHNQVYSYNALDNEDFNGEDMFVDNQTSVEQAVIDKFTREQLYTCVEMLNQNERMLLNRIYYCGESLRHIAKTDHVPVTTLQYRHRKLLEKLKGLMGEGEN